MSRASKSFLKHNSRFSKTNLSFFLIIFILIGGIAIWRSLAAPNPNLPGDLNGDNVVNIQDLSILLSNYGTTSATADINGDGLVNVLDLSALLSHYGQSYSGASNVSVDFNTITQPLASLPFSGTISTYGESGGSIAGSAKQRTELGGLGPGLYRIPLKWNGGNIISAAGGGPTNISGDTWINDIKAFGGTPMIVLGGATADNNFLPSDAASMVSHFNGSNGPKVSYWVIGNEPNNAGISISSYCSLFNNTVSAMKAIDPTIKVAGPAWSYFNLSDLTSFLQCAGSSVDIVDYHHYGMGSSFLDNVTALSQTSSYETEIKQIKQAIAQQVPSRVANIEVQVGEFNWSWRTADGYQGSYNGDDRFYQAVNTVWSASVVGHIVSGGGRAHQYSDQNGALGITFEKSADAAHFGKTVDDPMPIYYGIQMFSGGSLFRGFGSSLVKTSTSLSGVEVFASTNQKNVVLINKNSSASQTAVLQLGGTSSTSADEWQTNMANPFSPPQKISAIPIQANGLQITLPPYSVTTVVLN